MILGLTDQQKAERRLGLGGSDACKVMSGQECWPDLWREKTGRAEPENLSDNLRVQMGHATEPFNAFWFEKVTGRTVMRRNETIVSERYTWMRANVDGVTTAANGAPAYVDFKHVGKSDEAMILRYTPQMVHLCTILGLDRWILSVLIGNSKHEIIEQAVDPFYQGELICREAEFWGYVERDEEPPFYEEPIAPPKPQPKLRIVQLDDEFRDAWPNWALEMNTLCGDFERTHAAAAAHAITRESIRRLLPDDVGLVTRNNTRISRSKAGAVTIALKEKGNG